MLQPIRERSENINEQPRLNEYLYLNLERMQEAVLAPGSVPNHIIMDENMADFLIIGGGIAGNLLANRIHNSLSCLSMDVNFGQFFNDRENSKILKFFSQMQNH